jgi:hypothetical protein
MFKKNLVSVPRIGSQTPQTGAIEWEIPGQVSVAFMLVDEFGYSLMAKVRIDKKHWWNRPWKTFIAHAPTPDEAARKGLEFLESFGYRIDFDARQLEEMTGDPGRTDQG